MKCFLWHGSLGFSTTSPIYWVWLFRSSFGPSSSLQVSFLHSTNLPSNLKWFSFSGKGLKDRDVLVHALNSVMSISDIFISKRPCRMLHFHHSLAALIPYVTFSAIYWAAGGTRENGLSYIYPILNWENLSLTVPFLMMGLIFGLPFVHGIIWSLHLLRDRLIRCCKCDDHHDHQSQWNSAFVPDDKSADSTIVIKA